MAALDFPASPTNGQVYANWIYSTAKGAWQAKPITGKVTTSATAPSAPSNGDEWFNTNDGNLYVYYTDIDGSQWVQVKSDATLSSTLGNRVELLEAKPSGLVPIIPSSVTLGSGSGSVAADGLVTFSGASNVSIDGVFTSAYTNYRVVAHNLTGSNATDMNARFRASGATITNSVYYTAAALQRADAVSSVYSGFNGIGYTSLAPVTIEVGWSAFVWDIYQPAVSSTQTTSNFYSTGYQNYIQNRNGNVTFNQTQAVDGFNLFPNSTSNLGGKIKIYGYR